MKKSSEKRLKELCHDIIMLDSSLSQTNYKNVVKELEDKVRKVVDEVFTILLTEFKIGQL